MVTLIVLKGAMGRVWVARTCSTWEVADAEGEGPEGAVGGGMGVAADHGHAGLGQAQLRADGVDDSLVGIAQRVEAHPELGAVGAQGLDLGRGW